MAVKTQGTQLFMLYPTREAGEVTYDVRAVECMNSFDGGGNPADQIVIECLEASSREYLKGMRSPGQATFTIDADPRNDSHINLHEAAESDDEMFDNILFALGWSDGPRDADGAQTSVPTVNSAGDDFELPTDRTWFVFDGYVVDFPFDFQSNTTVKTNVQIQRSGRGFWLRKGRENGGNG